MLWFWWLLSIILFLRLPEVRYRLFHLLILLICIIVLSLYRLKFFNIFYFNLSEWKLSLECHIKFVFIYLSHFDCMIYFILKEHVRFRWVTFNDLNSSSISITRWLNLTWRSWVKILRILDHLLLHLNDDLWVQQRSRLLNSLDLLNLINFLVILTAALVSHIVL